MNIFIDCEFNEFKGNLISMALVADDGQEFYEALPCDNPGRWVAEHVMPIINQEPVPMAVFQTRLQKFLLQYETVHIIADWPEDLKHFCEALISGPGERLNTPPLTMEILRFDAESDLPHNALADARGNAKYYKENIEFKLEEDAIRAMIEASEQMLADVMAANASIRFE